VDGPPLDPDDWSAEQWQAYLQATDGGDDDGPAGADDRDDGASVFRRVKASGLGTVMGAGMLGLEQALYGEREQEKIVAEADDDDPDRELSTFDPDDPTSSVISLAPEPSGAISTPLPAEHVEPTDPIPPDRR
jgi:hypothetical protein